MNCLGTRITLQKKDLLRHIICTSIAITLFKSTKESYNIFTPPLYFLAELIELFCNSSMLLQGSKSSIENLNDNCRKSISLIVKHNCYNIGLI